MSRYMLKLLPSPVIRAKMSRYMLILSLLLKVSFGDLLLKLNETTFAKRLESVKLSKYDPETVDWREEGHVSPVKDQGSCEACWAFAIVGTLESHESIFLKKKTLLSEQFLIDCLPSSRGCEPMSLLKPYADLVSVTGGVLADKDYYPYEERQRQCRWSPPSNSGLPTRLNTIQSDNHAMPAVLVTGFQRIKPDEDDMAAYVAAVGPITAAINPTRMANYKGNYIDEPSDDECDPDDRRHTVTIVGYNSTTSKSGRVVKYWIIKNSWGSSWGDHGYYYLVRGRNACGIAADVVIPMVGSNNLYLS